MKTLKNCFFRSLLVLAAINIIGLSPASAISTLENGDFSDGLTGWDATGPVVFFDDGINKYIRFEENESGLPGTLSQHFILPTDAATLSFEVQMFVPVITPTNALTNETEQFDLFTASLQDLTTPSDPYIFYFLDNPGAMETVSTDVSALRGKEVLLLFNLQGFSNDISTVVWLDNVEVSPVLIPAPGALTLGLIGTAAIGLLRKLRF